jgi:hypothetical protein
MDDTLTVYTFGLIDGRSVSFAGLSESEAHRRAFGVHGNAVAQWFGTPAAGCRCEEKHAGPVREGGWLVCRDCAGLIGA